MLKAGDLMPGSPMMSERELIETYGVGRSSAREALRVLEARGLIVAGDRGSFVVADPRTTLTGAFETLPDLQHGTFRHVYEVCRMIEVEDAALAAARRDESQLVEMAETLGEQRRASRDYQEGRGDIRAITHSDVRFHMAIAAASANPLSLTIMKGIRPLLGVAQAAVAGVVGLNTTSPHEHRAILDAIRDPRSAIRDADPDAAAAAIRAHLERVEHDAERILDRPALNPRDIRLERAGITAAR